MSFEHPAQRLATLEPATSRWIATAAGRRSRIILACTAMIAVAQLSGMRIDLRAYVALFGWIGATFVMAPWAARPPEFARRLRRYAFTLVIDVLLLGAVYVFLDASQWLGAMFFMNAALVASATLPRRYAIGVAALIVLVFAIVAWLPVLGVTMVVSPFGTGSADDHQGRAVAQIVSTITFLVIVMRLQVRLVQTIREAEQRYLLLVQSAPDMLMTFDADGRFESANPATLELMGYTWRELKQLPNAAFFPPEDWPQVTAAHARSLAGETVTMEVRLIRKGGEMRWLQTRSVPIAGGATGTSVLVMARDITIARSQAEQLRENEQRVRLIVDALGIGFGTIDRSGRVTSIFGRWAQKQEGSHRTVIGARARDVVDPEITDQVVHALDKAFAGENVALQWSVGPPRVPEERFYRAHFAPTRDADRNVVGAACVWIDESVAIAAERERDVLRGRVANAERIESLAKLVSGVAHELNNPLAAILNFSEDLLLDARTDADRSALEVIQAQALRSRTIVRDLLTFVRSGYVRPRARETAGPILEMLVVSVRPGLAAQGIAFDASISDPETPLFVDRPGFEQVVTNLLTNAAQAAGAGGAVRLATQRQGDWFDVIVEDNGAGIREEHLVRIFEPFFSTKPTGQGVGLGLSVSLGIVEANGGELRAENRGGASGGGARFTMRLPVAPADATEPAELAAASPDTQTRPRARRAVRSAAGALAPLPPRRACILIIDDEESIRLVLRRFFQRRGWAVEEAADGTAALVKLLRPDAAVRYDVVLCDLKMPGLSGPELYRRLTAEAPAMMDHLILSSGDVTAVEVAGFLATVSVPVLEKPFELNALEAVAEKIRRGSEGPR